MATYTTNLNLKKPAQSDKIRIADINNNMEEIDAAFGAVGNDSVATQLGDIQGAIAIVATGNAHAAITAGQFVYVKGHDTLDTGLYVATSNISQNGTLSSSNLTADTAGGLNALSDQIRTMIPASVTVTPDLTKINGSFAGVKSGHTVVLYMNNVIPISAISSDTTIATITAAKPTNQAFGVCKNIQDDDVFVFVDTSGNIKISGITGAAASKQIYGTLTYLTND